MKVNFKQLSKKTLSCILALAVILCSVTVMFSAFAETEPEAAEPYTISYRSPAIPMFVGKQVLLTDLEVDFSEEDGDTYPADKVIWTHVEGESAQILGGGFYAVKTGMTKFTATYGGKVQNVYVIVNNAGDYDFELVNLDLTKTGEGGYVAEDWLAAGGKTNFTPTDLYIKEPTGITQNSTSGLNTGNWTDGIIVYNSDILKDFADYTLDAQIVHSVATSTYSPVSIALLTRVQHNDAVGETLFKGGLAEGKVLGVQFALYGGPTIFNLPNPRDYFTGDTNFFFGETQLSTLPVSNFQYGNAGTSYAYSQNSGKVFSVKVDGDDLVVKVDGVEVLNSNADTVYTSTLNPGKRQTGTPFSEEFKLVEGDNVTGAAVSQAVAATTLQKGTIGFESTYHDKSNLKSVKVSLNIDENSVMPNLQAPAFYTVKAASPAIPMFEGKVVALSDIALEIGGSLISGDLAEWTVTEGDNVIITGDALYAASTGIAKLTAKYDEETQTVYVMVNKAGDYDFYLVDIDFQNDASDYTLDNWMYANNNVTYDLYYDGDARGAMNNTSYRNANNASDKASRMFLTTFGGKKVLRVSGEYYGSMFLYNAPILKDFADYTITTNLRVDTLWGDGFPDFTTFARAQVNFNVPYSKPVSDTDKTVDTTVPTIFAGQGADGADGTALALRHRPFGGLLISANRADCLNLDGKTGIQNYGYHSLSDISKIYGTINSDGIITAGAPDINYVLGADGSYANHGGHIYTNARTSKLEYVLDGSDIKYSINNNVILDTKNSNIYRTNHTTRDGADVQTDVTDIYHEQFANYGTTAAGNAIGFGGFASGASIFDLKVKLNGISEETMPKLQDPTFFVVKDASPAIPMYVDKFVHLSDIVIEEDGKIFSAADLKWTVKEGSAMLINGGIYVTKVGITTLATTINGVEKRVYVFANNEGDNDFYIVNEVLNAANYVDDEWIFANAPFSVPAAGYTVLDPGYTKGDYEDKPANGGTSSLDTTGVQKGTDKIGVGYKEHGMLIYKSEMLKDFADYTAEFSYTSNGASWEHQATFILRADVDYNVAVGETIFPNYATGGKYNALALQFKKFGAPSLRNMTDPFNTVQAQWEKIGYHTVDNFAKIQYSTHGNYNPLYVLGDGTNRKGTVTVKTSGLDVLAKINGNTVLDTTEETIKTVTYTKNAAWADDIIVEGESITSAAFKETIATKTNTGAGTVGLLISRSDQYAFSFTSLTVKLNNTKEDMPKLQDPVFYRVTAANPVIPMTAGTKLDIGSLLVEVDGGLVTSSSFTWSFADAAATDIKVEDGYVYAYERGTYTATITNGTVTDYIHFVVKNPEETEYVIYENDYREADADVSDWKSTVVANGVDQNANLSGNYIDQNTLYKDWSALTGNPFGFAPYNSNAFNTEYITKEWTAYTTLDNDVLADLSDYKVTAGMKVYSNYRGAIGFIGRVSNTVDGKFVVGSSGAVGLGTNATGSYRLNNNNFSNGTFIINNGAKTAVGNAALKYYYFDSTKPRSFDYRSFEIDFSGNTATYTIPNGEKEVVSGLTAQKGTIGIVGLNYNSYDENKETGVYDIISEYASLPILTDVKVVLNNVDVSALTFEKIDHAPAAIPEKEIFVDKGNYEFGLSETGYINTYTKTDDAAYSRKVVIPHVIDDRNISDIGTMLSTYGSGKVQLTYGELVISEGLSKSYENFVHSSYNLEYVTIPKSFSTIPNRGFNSSGLREISFPEGSRLTDIGYEAFQNCNSLHTVKLPEGLKTIGASAFRNCKVLYDINIPSTVETIAYQAFEAVPVKNVTLPAATTSLGDNAFANCTYLEKVYVLNASMTIGATAIPATATIYGYTGSTAAAYAEANGNTFVAIDNIESNEMAANTAFDLKQAKFTVAGTQVAGSDITWTAHRGADYEISNGWLLVYGEEDITITGTSAAGDVSINIAVAPKGTETGLVVKTFADKNMTIAPVANDATAYTVKINETDSVALKYGTLTVTADKCDAVKIANAIGDKGDTFGFEVIKPETMVLAAEYTTLAEREASIYPLGAQVRPKTNTYSAGIRFITRFPEIKAEPAGIYLDEAYSQVGVLIIPYVLWDGTTIPDAEALSKADVPMGRYNASNVVINKLMTANEAYADAAALLTGIPSSMYGVDIMALPYLIGTDGEVTYIEGDPMIKSYNDVLDASYPEYNGNVDNLFYGGTDHDIDGIDSTTALTYETGEDITFSLNLKGAYKFNWELDKDDPDVNAIAELGEIASATKTLVKSGSFDPATDGSVFSLTTKMNQAGVVRLKVMFTDVSGTAIATIYMSAAADYENITQSLEELDYSAEEGYVEGMSSADFLVAETTSKYNEFKTVWDAQLLSVKNAIAADAAAKVAAGQQDLAAWLADNNKSKGDEYTIGDLLKLTVAVNNGKYTAYEFRIATGEAGLNLIEGSNGNLVDNTAISSNDRPSIGTFAIENDAANVDIYAEFKSWGGGTASTGAPAAGRLAVRPMLHGRGDNNGANDLNSGVNSADPTEIELYGVLKRDYIAVNLAKALFADKLAANATIKTNGGSAGGWQAVTYAALDADVTEIDTDITWVCQLGASAAGDITSWHPVDCAGSRIYSTVTAARIINERVKNGTQNLTIEISGGLGDYQASAPHGLIAMYNAFTDAKVTKSLTFKQFREHGNQVYNTFTEFDSVLSNK